MLRLKYTDSVPQPAPLLAALFLSQPFFLLIFITSLQCPWETTSMYVSKLSQCPLEVATFKQHEGIESLELSAHLAVEKLGNQDPCGKNRDGNQVPRGRGRLGPEDFILLFQHKLKAGLLDSSVLRDSYSFNFQPTWVSSPVSSSFALSSILNLFEWRIPVCIVEETSKLKTP